jgi:hypothetical protein
VTVLPFATQMVELCVTSSESWKLPPFATLALVRASLPEIWVTESASSRVGAAFAAAAVEDESLSLALDDSSEEDSSFSTDAEALPS